MANFEEIARLILQAETRGFEDAEEKIQSTEGRLDALKRGYEAGAYPLEYYIRRGEQLQSQLDRLVPAYKKAEDALKQYGSAQAALEGLKADKKDRADNDNAGAKDDDQTRKANRLVVADTGVAADADADANANAQARARGATPDQAFDPTHSVQDVLKSLNRPIRAERTGEPENRIAPRIASQKKAAASDQVKALSETNLSNTGKLLSVTSQLDAEVTRLQAIAQEQGRKIDGLLRRRSAVRQQGNR
jgi:hypothetical protein